MRKLSTTKVLLLSALLLLAVLVAAGLILGIKGDESRQPLSRSVAEVKALEGAIEAYNVDHGDHPSDPNSTDLLVPNTTFDPATYVASSAFLYRALAGSGTTTPAEGKAYFTFSPMMLRTSSRGHTYIVDPKGNSYGYSTFERKHPNDSGGNNPTFDLWSIGGGKSKADQNRWVKDW